MHNVFVIANTISSVAGQITANKKFRYAIDSQLGTVLFQNKWASIVDVSDLAFEPTRIGCWFFIKLVSFY